MPKLIYLTREQLELIHAGVLAKSAGLFGTREHGVLLGLEDSPRQEVFGKELYPTIFHKAAVYARTIITQHPFLDGNKRTGIMAALTFLDVNGHTITASDDDVFDEALAIATQKPEIEEIAAWLESHTMKAASARKGKK
ncbi:MAG TPA: type II toxin-antitoxin system death-on-curing family toxin [Candidatus Paceibacterota bacterium]|nr:type II toxin-antitoxin system death-on-curing family toxin [Candidatus Paceibacterota bacterium]